jgi:hypothetical protein
MRARPTPRWLSKSSELDVVAQRRCLMILSVLSGEKPVTQVVTELSISRPLYYQLETRALAAMLVALTPGSDGASTAAEASPAAQLATLEAKVTRLERDKRRLERLLYLARKLVPSGPVVMGPGRPRKRTVRSSMPAGRRPSRSSTKPTMSTASTSIPTPAGETTS